MAGSSPAMTERDRGYPASGCRRRVVDGPDLCARRSWPVADLRADGRGELRAWRVPDARHVRDVRAVAVHGSGPAACRVSRGTGAVRAGCGDLPAADGTRTVGAVQPRHGADLCHVRPGDLREGA